MMEYILIPSKSKSETSFFIDLLKKMRKDATTLSAENMEDIVFITLLKEAEKSPADNMSKVKTHLRKVISKKWR